jgi:hypothetical protein
MGNLELCGAYESACAKNLFCGACKLYAPPKYVHFVAHGIVCTMEMFVSVAHMATCATEIWWDPPLSQGA